MRLLQDAIRTKRSLVAQDGRKKWARSSTKREFRAPSLLPLFSAAERLFADEKETANNAVQASQAPADSQGPTPGEPGNSLWKYSGFMDFGYLLDFNHPADHLFRDRGTTFKVDELDLNMAGAGFKKEATENSRWGTELAVQAGEDSANFGFSATAPNLSGADVLRHFGAANVSYLAPVASGLTV